MLAILRLLNKKKLTCGQSVVQFRRRFYCPTPSVNSCGGTIPECNQKIHFPANFSKAVFLD
jgi:hypothetical protein